MVSELAPWWSCDQAGSILLLCFCSNFHCQFSFTSIKSSSSLSNYLHPKTSFFCWRLFHHETPTLLWAQRMGIQLASACPFCLRAEESVMYFLFLCLISTGAWRWFYSHCRASPLSLLPSHIWQVISDSCYNSTSLVLDALMGIMSHVIWKARRTT